MNGFAMSFQTRLRFGFNISLALIFALAAWESKDFLTPSHYMPVFASLVGLALMLVLIYLDFSKWRRVGYIAADEEMGTASLGGLRHADRTPPGGDSQAGVAPEQATKMIPDQERERAALAAVGLIWVWLLGYVGLIYAAGLTVGTAVFLTAYLRLQGARSWRFAISGTACALLALHLVTFALNLPLPRFLLDGLYRFGI